MFFVRTSLLWIAVVAAAQSTGWCQMHGMPEVRGEAMPPGEPAANLFTLEALEQVALERNPTLIQVATQIEASRAKSLQAGLYPNPTVGYQAELIGVKNGAGRSTAGDFQSRFIGTCAWLHSDRLAKMAGSKPSARIVPFRGEYYKIRPERQFLVRNLIYPVPDPKFPFLGVHFTRLIHGGIEAGPNAVLALAREGYHWTQINLRDSCEALFFPGLWRFLAAYPSMCGYEIRRSLSRSEFTRSLQKLVPEIQSSDLAPGGAGVRAQAMSPDGKLVEDFHFEDGNSILHVLNAPSPAATASLAIGDHISQRVLKRL